MFIAHDLSMVKYISDRVMVMYLGKVVEITASNQLYANPMHPYTKALLSAIPIPDPKVEEGKERIKMGGEIPSPVRSRQDVDFKIDANMQRNVVERGAEVTFGRK